jgi:leucyl-tRNA synthetase
MSKSLFNGVPPSTLLPTFGADATRLFALFKAPPERNLEWETHGVRGIERWLARVWVLVDAVVTSAGPRGAQPSGARPSGPEHPTDAALRRSTARAVAAVTTAVFATRTLNTGVAALMTLSNEIQAACDTRTAGDAPLVVSAALARSVAALVAMLAPYAPHVAAEMWRELRPVIATHGGGGVLFAYVWGGGIFFFFFFFFFFFLFLVCGPQTPRVTHRIPRAPHPQPLTSTPVATPPPLRRRFRTTCMMFRGRPLWPPISSLRR